MRLLLVEDDLHLKDSLAFQLESCGYQVDSCDDGEDAKILLEQNNYDLVLLDRMLPHIDGVTLLKQYRKTGNQTPVILLTALGELKDKITGLDSGADDYLVKPFAFEELIARIRSIMRRPVQWQDANILNYADLTYASNTHILSTSKGQYTLSGKEGALMELLLKNHGQTLPRTTILSNVWGADADIEDGNLDNYIYFIRRRLKSVSSSVTVRTIRGTGYLLE